MDMELVDYVLDLFNEGVFNLEDVELLICHLS